MAVTPSPNTRSRKGLLARLFSLGAKQRPSDPLVIPRAEHEISRKNMDEEVLKVLYRLHNSGHKAYLVGGAVRDLLLGRKPKDYDVATDARPDQIKKLFRNSRLIGRRFRLAHIVFKGGKVVEVSTFRRTPVPQDDDTDASGEKDLLIREDNTWGNAQQDAFRRDFTINGLFYNVADFSVIDYVGGLADLKEEVIRTIGDPNIRFREDPVRMLRAIEYAARLNFTLHPDVERALNKHRRDLRRASENRVTDELMHLLKSGAAAPAFKMMLETGMLEVLHPELYRAVEGGRAERFFKDLSVVDIWAIEGRKVRDVALLAVLFSPLVRRDTEAAEEQKGGRLSKGEYLDRVEKVLDRAATLYQIPNRRAHQLQQAMLAARKMRRRPSRHRGLSSMVTKGYFLNALAILELEVASLGEHGEILEEWMKLKREAEKEGRLADPDERRGRGRGSRSGQSRGGRGRGRGDDTRRRDSSKRSDGRSEERKERPQGDASRQKAGSEESRSSSGEDRSRRRRSRGRRSTRSSRSGERSEGSSRPSQEQGSSQPSPEEVRQGQDDGNRKRQDEGSQGRQERGDRQPRDRGRDRGGRHEGRSRQRRERAPRSPDSGQTASTPAPEPPREQAAPAARVESVQEPKATVQASSPEVKTPERKPASAPPVEATAPEKPDAALVTPSSPEVIEHGRGKRDQRSWGSIAGERSSTVRQMKERIEAGEMSMPREGDIPFVKPGHSMSETTGDWAANVGKADDIASNGSVDESQKWGRTKRPRERR